MLKDGICCDHCIPEEFRLYPDRYTIDDVRRRISANNTLNKIDPVEKSLKNIKSSNNQLTGLSKTIYDVGKKLGEGGEGTIYSVSGDSSKVLKIYKANVNTDDKYKKMSAMIKLAPNGVKYTTWPIDLLFNNERKFVGFVMKRIPDKIKINEVYDTSAETNYNWRQRAIFAHNLCAIVSTIHEIKQVCGDFNPNNICIDLSDKGNLYLIDTDSFHIQYGGTLYRCSVGMTYYLPREIQQRMKGESLAVMKTPTFTEDTDNFALAIHVFQLLMNGCHPFTMSKINLGDSTVCPPVEDNILEGRSAFFSNNSGYAIPVYAPPIDILPADLQILFRRAFVDSYTKGPNARPKAAEWCPVLKKLIENTKVCANNSKHLYYNGLKECPWCKIEKDIADRLSGGVNPPVKAPVKPTPAAPPSRKHPNAPTAGVKVSNTQSNTRQSSGVRSNPQSSSTQPGGTNIGGNKSSVSSSINVTNTAKNNSNNRSNTNINSKSSSSANTVTQAAQHQTLSAKSAASSSVSVRNSYRAPSATTNSVTPSRLNRISNKASNGYQVDYSDNKGGYQKIRNITTAGVANITIRGIVTSCYPKKIITKENKVLDSLIVIVDDGTGKIEVTIWNNYTGGTLTIGGDYTFVRCKSDIFRGVIQLKTTSTKNVTMNHVTPNF